MKRALVVVLLAGCQPHPPRSGLPALDDLSSIDLEQKQGRAPARCGLVDYRVHVDLERGTWTSGTCTADWQAPDAIHAALVPKQGTLTATDRDALAASYRTLHTRTKQGCGQDGGDLTLTVTRKDGSTATFLDENWGCRKPPPVVVEGLGAFGQKLMQLFL